MIELLKALEKYIDNIVFWFKTRKIRSFLTKREWNLYNLNKKEIITCPKTRQEKLSRAKEHIKLKCIQANLSKKDKEKLTELLTSHLDY